MQYKQRNEGGAGKGDADRSDRKQFMTGYDKIAWASKQKKKK